MSGNSGVLLGLREWRYIVRSIENLAYRYELANKILSGFTIDLFRRKIARLVTPKDVVLEVGCGTGEFLKHVLNAKEIICLDPSKKLLRIARSRYGTLNRVKFLEGYAEDIPLPESSVTKIYSVFAFRDFMDKRKSLKEFWRVLKPKGLAVILDVQRSIPSLLYGKFARLFGKVISLSNNENWNPFEAFDLSVLRMGSASIYRNLAFKAGFDRVYVETVAGIIMILYMVKWGGQYEPSRGY